MSVTGEQLESTSYDEPPDFDDIPLSQWERCGEMLDNVYGLLSYRVTCDVGIRSFEGIGFYLHGVLVDVDDREIVGISEI